MTQQRDMHKVIVNGIVIYSGTNENKADQAYYDNEQLGIQSQWLVNECVFIELET